MYSVFSARKVKFKSIQMFVINKFVYYFLKFRFVFILTFSLSLKMIIQISKVTLPYVNIS